MNIKIILLVFAILIPSALFSQIAVIANKNVKDKVTLSKLSDIYALESTSLGDIKVQPFDFRNDGDLKDKFYTKLGKSALDFRKGWLKKKLTGNGNPPVSVDSPEEMIQKIASTPGAIGYIEASKVNASVVVILEF